MPQHHVPGDGQSETGTACVAASGLVQADEPLEDPLPVLRSDPGTVVALDGARRVPLGILQGQAKVFPDAPAGTRLAMWADRAGHVVPHPSRGPRRLSRRP